MEHSFRKNENIPCFILVHQTHQKLPPDDALPLPELAEPLPELPEPDEADPDPDEADPEPDEPDPEDGGPDDLDLAFILINCG